MCVKHQRTHLSDLLQTHKTEHKRTTTKIIALDTFVHIKRTNIYINILYKMALKPVNAKRIVKSLL